MLAATSYLAAAALFYWAVARRAPREEETAFAYASQSTPCEVIELFTAEQAEQKAA